MAYPSRFILSTLVGPWLVHFVSPLKHRVTGGWVDAENLITGEHIASPKNFQRIAAIVPYELWPEFAQHEKTNQSERLF